MTYSDADAELFNIFTECLRRRRKALGRRLASFPFHLELEAVRAEIANAIASLQQLAKLLYVMPPAPKPTVASAPPPVEPLKNEPIRYQPALAKEDPIVVELLERIEQTVGQPWRKEH